jgi:hypothetical protein
VYQDLMEEVNISTRLSNHFSLHRHLLARIVPYTPQQNGVVEQKNRAIMEMAHCILQKDEAFILGGRQLFV